MSSVYQCPQCGEVMEECSSFGCFSFSDADPSTEYWDSCKKCGITYRDGVWNIPARYPRPTEKQLKCIRVIEMNLGVHCEPKTRAEATRFISKHINASYTAAAGRAPHNVNVEREEACTSCYEHDYPLAWGLLKEGDKAR